MEGGFTLKESLFILESKSTQKTMQQILDNLSQGFAVEQFFDRYVPNSIRSHFVSFLSCLPFADALKLAMHLQAYDHSSKNQIVKSLLGPGTLLMGCLIGIQIFNSLCFPVLLKLMRGFHVQLTMLEIFQRTLSVLIGIVFLVFLFVFVIVLYFSRPKHIVLGYVLLSKIKLHHVIRHFISTQFAYYFDACTKMGNSTQVTLKMLQKNQQKPLIVFLAYHVEQALLSGETMETAVGNQYLDPMLRKFMQIAIHSASLQEMLQSYIIQSEYKGQQICKRWTQRITLVSYASIGLLIILIYQILFLPLSIMGQV